MWSYIVTKITNHELIWSCPVITKIKQWKNPTTAIAHEKSVPVGYLNEIPHEWQLSSLCFASLQSNWFTTCLRLDQCFFFSFYFFIFLFFILFYFIFGDATRDYWSCRNVWEYRASSPRERGCPCQGEKQHLYLKDVIQRCVREAGLHGGQHVVGVLALLRLTARRRGVLYQRVVHVITDLLKVLPSVLQLLYVTEK